ncbi:hypothetical protein K469DRAFT_588829, partial [Zopfia rhizophila CBS 207.26]
MSQTITLVISTVVVVLFSLLGLALALASTNGRRISDNQGKARKFLTFRISNVPQSLSEGQFRDILISDDMSTAPDNTAQANLLGWSFAPAAASTISERFCVATATFRVPPAASKLEATFKRKIGVGAGRLKVDLDFFGLTPLADPQQNVNVDIIAVTGLAGHAFGSWKSKRHSDMWLRDFLPKSIPNARILTYGYDTRLPGSQSDASILELSRSLLESIKTIRTQQAKQRPLILIGHSLGGLVVKQALVQAADGSQDDKAVFMSCYAVMLFGVPNRGLNDSSLVSMVKGQPNEDLVRSLNPSSRFASLLHEMFYMRFMDDSKIICIYETEETRTVVVSAWERNGPPVMMVPHTSAIYAGKNEEVYDQLSINADHSGIVKFSDPSNHNYLIIESRITKLAADAHRIIKDRFVSHEKDTQLKYIRALKAPDYITFRENGVDRPIPGTCRWFLNEKLVRYWRENEESSILWIKGSPGQGKTVLCKFLLDDLDSHLRDSLENIKVVYFFFYDQDETLRTVGAALRSLLRQLLSAAYVFQYIYDNDRVDLDLSAESEDNLWKALEAILRAPIFNTIYCVLDALDECIDEKSRERLLKLISGLVQIRPSKARNLPVLKLFVTSRPTVPIFRELDRFPSISLKANPQDLEVFIQHMITTTGLSEDLHKAAIELLLCRVEQTFLWVSIVLRLARMEPLLSLSGLKKIIDESPTDLKELYGSIVDKVMQGAETVQKLLVWAVYGRSPLRLEELEEALAIQMDSKSQKSIYEHRVFLRENVISGAVGVMLEVSDDRRVHLIHQSAKDFLLKDGRLTAAVFCDNLHPSAYLAKVCMVYLNFEDFRTGPCRDRKALVERKRQYPLLHYAAHNWHRHIRSEDDASGTSDILSRLIEPRSPTLLAWGEASGIPDLDKAVDTLDIATRANIAWLTEFQSSSFTVGEDRVVQAANNGVVGYNMEVAAENEESGKDIMELLLREYDAQITDDAVLAIAERFDVEVIRLMMDERENVKVTERVIKKAAARNCTNGKEAMTLLLEHRHQDVLITAEVVKAMARHFDKEVMTLLLQQCGQHISITEEVVKAAAGNEWHGKGVVTVLLQQRGQDITITEEVVKAAAGNFENGKDVITLLLGKRGDYTTITEQVVSIIARRFDKEVMALLLDKQGDQIPITEEVVKAAAGNYGNGKEEVMALLLDKRGDQITITEEVVKAAAGNSGNGKDVMALLLDRRGDQIIITEEVVKAAAGSYGNGKEVMALLLDKRGDQITITKEVVKAAAGNSWNGKEVIALLLDKRGDQITITEEVIKTAAGNSGNGKDVMALLLDRRGDQITITEEVVKAVAGNYGNGKEVMALLLDKRGDQITITEEVVKAAAGNYGNGKEVMALLLDKRGDQITITVEVVKAAAENSGNGKEVIALLFEKRGDQITISEEVIKAAAGNYGNGKDVMALL